jgi:deoxyribodipyrimidine photo-lyase
MTGYPIVDAGMRELWQTGWMHNRIRMVVGLLPDQAPDDRLAQGRGMVLGHAGRCRSASNAASWQWVAGSGADAAPYFRIFNPVLQGEKFDPDGNYVRRFVPELAKMPSKYIHKPWDAPDKVLNRCRVPWRNLSLHLLSTISGARNRALAAYEADQGRRMNLHMKPFPATTTRQ